MSDQDLAQKIKNALADVKTPQGQSLSEFNGLSDIIVTPSAVAFTISVPDGMEGAFGPVSAQATELVQQLAPEHKVLVSITENQAPAQARTGSANAASGPAGAGAPGQQKLPVKGVKQIIAVASGKGGVGKSTCATNIAVSLANLGHKVGLLDADIYGPSIPKLVGLEGKPALRQDGIFEPFRAFGLSVMSIGPMIEGDQAVAWRGPMASSALRQLLRETDWGELDYLIIDMPPGTGDIQISLCQQVQLAGAIIISTPQDLALIDAKKAVDLFSRLHVPLLGLVENMSYFIAPDTQKRYDIFGHGGAKQAAQELGIPFLGEIPIEQEIRRNSDAGTPIAALKSENNQRLAFENIVKNLINQN